MSEKNEKDLHLNDENESVGGNAPEQVREDHTVTEYTSEPSGDEAAEIPVDTADAAEDDGNDADGENCVEDDCVEDDCVEDDEDNFAAVAERITGVRHTVAATAAPIRVRESTGRVPTQPKPTAGIPVREKSENDAEPEAAQPAEAPRKGSSNRIFAGVIASALAVVVLLGAIIITVNVTAEKERPADITIGNLPDGDAEAIIPDTDETDGLTAPDETAEAAETDEPAGNDKPAETDEPSGTDEPVGSEPSAEPEIPDEPETEPEAAPEPVKFTVTIDFYDKDDITVVTEAITLEDLLAEAGCRLDETDDPSVSLDTFIAADAVIAIDKHIWLTETATEEIPYQSRAVEIDTIPRGTTNPIQYGENGVSTMTYAVEYINGAEVSRTLTSEEVTKWPVEEVYELGVGGSFVGADGVEYTYSYRRVVPATYYSIEGMTYLGTMADETVIAVDRTHIPLGTKLYVKNDEYDFGVRIASDVGSMIKEWEIDIWLDKSNPQFESFAHTGYHYDMEIYYID